MKPTRKAALLAGLILGSCLQYTVACDPASGYLDLGSFYFDGQTRYYDFGSDDDEDGGNGGSGYSGPSICC